MTMKQAMKKMQIARETGKAYIDKDTVVYYGHTGDPSRAEYSLQTRDGLRWNTVKVSYKPEKIAELIAY